MANKAEKNETALTPQETGYSALANVDMRQMMAEELDGLDAGFERIKIPSAGSTVYEIPGENPSEPENVKEFSAVILHHHPLHAFYKDKYTGGNTPPDCGSFDGAVGEGEPGGICKSCRNNQFGSGENNGKACKARRRMYLLREGEIFPLLLSLPTGSLKEFTKYIKRLLSRGKKSNSVVTRFSLKKAVNAGGIAYSQAQFAVDRTLTPEESTLINGLTEQVKEYSRRVAYDFDSAESDEIPMDESLVDPETGEVIEPLR